MAAHNVNTKPSTTSVNRAEKIENSSGVIVTEQSHDLGGIP